MKDILVADNLQLLSSYPKNPKVINCIVNHNPLINTKAKETTVETGLAIAEELFQILNKRGDGIGLAANQVGIDAQVAVVNVIEPVVLINPKILQQDNEIIYGEGCLSFPGHAIRTKRYRDVLIQSAQSESGWYFSGVPNISDDSRGSWEKDNSKNEQELRLLETICVQHEIDHLMGKTIHDREVKLAPTKVDKKVGRNQSCPCGSGKKYKKCCQ